jgi:hypothetical protein
MPETLSPGQGLGPEWRVEAFTPGARLLLRKDTTGDRARARSTAVVALGSLGCAAALAGATPAGLAMVTWPVVGLLLLVTALAVPAAVRSARRVWLGVTLEATRDGVSGWLVPRGAWHDLRARPVRASCAEVAAVEVQRAPHPPLVLSLLEVRLSSGARLAGPEVAVPVGDAPPLDAVAEALRAILLPGAARVLRRTHTSES